MLAREPGSPVHPVCRLSAPRLRAGRHCALDPRKRARVDPAGLAVDGAGHRSVRARIASRPRRQDLRTDGTHALRRRADLARKRLASNVMARCGHRVRSARTFRPAPCAIGPVEEPWIRRGTAKARLSLIPENWSAPPARSRWAFSNSSQTPTTPEDQKDAPRGRPSWCRVCGRGPHRPLLELGRSSRCGGAPIDPSAPCPRVHGTCRCRGGSAHLRHHQVRRYQARPAAMSAMTPSATG